MLFSNNIPEYMCGDDYMFPNECADQFGSIITPEASQYPCGCGGGSGSGSGSALMWSELESLPFLDMVPPDTDMIITTSSVSSSFPETFGVPEVAVPDALMPELFNVGPCDHDNNNSTNIISASQSLISSCINVHEDLSCDFKLESCNDLSAIYYAPATNNWGIHEGKPAPGIEEPTVTVGRYSVEERKDKILRYLKKRNQRNFNKTIKYACRKTLADKRVRVRGRFARKNELSEEDHMVTNKNNNNPDQEEREFYNNCAVQMKYDEEDWQQLQDAMGSLMYFPYIAG